MVLIGDFHPELSKEHARAKHPLSALLCSTSDPDCRATTAGWALRLEAVLALPHEDYQAAQKARLACDEKTKPGSSAKRFTRWAACVETSVLRREALALWPPRAPDSGWLIISGRRGHYQFCDGVHAFNLKTGAAYISQSCSGLALSSGGSVDHRATNGSRKPRFQRGFVNLANLRETMWMLLMIDRVTSVKSTGWIDIPEGVEITADRFSGMVGGFGIGGHAFSSAQTQLRWHVAGGQAARQSGVLTWPNNMNSKAADHAVKLLRVAEASFRDGCPKEKPPAIKRQRGATGVSGLDANPAELELLQSHLFALLVRGAQKPCRRRPGRPRT